MNTSQYYEPIITNNCLLQGHIDCVSHIEKYTSFVLTKENNHRFDNAEYY